MKVGILGQGFSGIFLALFLKEKNPKIDVTIIDKEETPGRKVLATGNGRCNITNMAMSDKAYNCEDAANIVNDFNAEDIVKFLNSLGIFTRTYNNLVYPYSNSAKTFLVFLVARCKERKVKFVNRERIVDYTLENGKIRVKTQNKIFIFDKFVFACGNAAAPQLGGSDQIFTLLEKKGYKVAPLRVGLAPIQTEEKPVTIQNERVKATVSLYIDKVLSYQENGEVLFKKDGLSGIAIFNCASVIARSKRFKKCTISLDLMPEYDCDRLVELLSKLNGESKASVLSGLFTKHVAEYVRKASGIKNLYAYTPTEIKKLAVTLKNLVFTYKATYDFKDAQVAVGGVEFSNIAFDLESKKEPGIYFAGEVLNADGLCGGYNISFAIASAHKVAESLLEAEENV